jgi:hypothetical protein
MTQHDEVTEPRGVVLPAAAPLTTDSTPAPLADAAREASAKDHVGASIAMALQATGNLLADRASAMVRTKLDEAALWLTRCAE